jgi:glycosyltransferase involved in cell wall biosynthesis
LKKKNVLFIGAFNKNTKDGSTGGQLFACTSLLNSELSQLYNFIKIDTTAETVPAPPVYKRLGKVSTRFVKFLFNLTFRRIETVLIFSSARLSFVEKGMMAIISRVFRKRVVFAPRSGLSLEDYETSPFMRWFMPKVITSSTFIICQGEIWKEFYKKISKCNDGKFVIIQNWINSNEYFIFNKINSKIPLIIYIGWLEEHKGIIDLLNSLKRLHLCNREFRCHIYGNGSLYEKCEVFINDNFPPDYVCLKGWANQEIKSDALKSADIYVMPSHFEGFPNALLEAMISEIAVIATNVGAVEEIVIDGFNGLITESHNPVKLAQNLETLLLEPDKRTQYAIEAKKTVLERFTLEIAVEKLKKIL